MVGNGHEGRKEGASEQIILLHSTHFLGEIQMNSVSLFHLEIDQVCD